MLRLLQLKYGSIPSRGSLDRAEINSRRPLAPLFLNRISRTESISYPQLPYGSSFWQSPRSRHSGEAPGVVILAKPQESSFWRSQNLRIGFCCAAALSGGQNKPHRINILSATRSGSIFCRHHQRQSLLFTPNPYVLSVLAATSTQ